MISAPFSVRGTGFPAALRRRMAWRAPSSCSLRGRGGSPGMSPPTVWNSSHRVTATRSRCGAIPLTRGGPDAVKSFFSWTNCQPSSAPTRFTRLARIKPNSPSSPKRMRISPRPRGPVANNRGSRTRGSVLPTMWTGPPSCITWASVSATAAFAVPTRCRASSMRPPGTLACPLTLTAAVRLFNASNASLAASRWERRSKTSRAALTLLPNVSHCKNVNSGFRLCSHVRVLLILATLLRKAATFLRSALVHRGSRG